jgi:hypothetical protein
MKLQFHQLDEVFAVCDASLDHKLLQMIPLAIEV